MVHDRRRRMNRAYRAGFTLMEVVLVLAIMAIIAATAWPGMQRLYAGRRVSAAADQVRSAWCQARVEAMRSGHTYAFRYELGGERFRTELQPDADASTSANGGTGNQAAGGAASATAAGDASHPAEDRTLPEGVRFSAAAASDPAAGSNPGAAPQPSAGAADGWSAPVFFYPDGTTSDVQLVLTGQRSCAIRVTLRGMTGTVTVADPDAPVE